MNSPSASSSSRTFSWALPLGADRTCPGEHAVLPAQKWQQAARTRSSGQDPTGLTCVLHLGSQGTLCGESLSKPLPPGEGEQREGAPFQQEGPQLGPWVGRKAWLVQAGQTHWRSRRTGGLHSCSREAGPAAVQGHSRPGGHTADGQFLSTAH